MEKDLFGSTLVIFRAYLCEIPEHFWWIKNVKGSPRGFTDKPDFCCIRKPTITPHHGARQPFHPRFSLSSLGFRSNSGILFHFKDPTISPVFFTQLRNYWLFRSQPSWIRRASPSLRTSLGLNFQTSLNCELNSAVDDNGVHEIGVCWSYNEAPVSAARYLQSIW